MGAETCRLGRAATEREWGREAARSAVRFHELCWANGELLTHWQINSRTTTRAANVTGPGIRRRRTKHDQWHDLGQRSCWLSVVEDWWGHSPTAGMGRRWDLVGHSHDDGPVGLAS